MVGLPRGGSFGRGGGMAGASHIGFIILVTSYFNQVESHVKKNFVVGILGLATSVGWDLTCSDTRSWCGPAQEVAAAEAALRRRRWRRSGLSSKLISRAFELACGSVRPCAETDTCSETDTCRDGYVQRRICAEPLGLTDTCRASRSDGCVRVEPLGLTDACRDRYVQRPIRAETDTCRDGYVQSLSV